MPKIDITKTELVWPGKYNEDGTLKEVPRVNLPFQVIETVNESRATREAKKGGVQGSLFDFYEGNEGWREACPTRFHAVRAENACSRERRNTRRFLLVKRRISGSGHRASSGGIQGRVPAGAVNRGTT